MSTICEMCGAVGYPKCHGCIEKDRFEKAEKIAEKDYDGPVCVPIDAYFPDIKALRELYDVDERPFPSYVYACSIIHHHLDFDRVIEMISKDAHEEWEPDASEELEAFIEQWNAKQKSVSWMVDHSRVIILDAANDEKKVA